MRWRWLGTRYTCSTRPVGRGVAWPPAGSLEFLATGGIYLGGGLAPRLLSWLRRPAFLEAFRAKGRMRPILESIPVRVILEPRAALFGAARHAAGQGGTP